MGLGNSNDENGLWVRLRRAVARGMAAAFVAWVLAVASRHGLWARGDGLPDWLRSDLIGLVAAVLDLMLQCLFSARPCGASGRRPPDDDDDGRGGGAPAGTGFRRAALHRNSRLERSGAIDETATAAAPTDDAVGGSIRKPGGRASVGGLSERRALADWVGRVRRTGAP